MALKSLVGISLEVITPARETSGDIIPESAVSECLSQAESFYIVARDWLNMNRPDLL
jgi:hypothetical protein